MSAKISLLPAPTPLVELRNSPHHLESKARIFFKCDDTAPLGGGGNKLRKLEHLVVEALEQHSDTLITIGDLQSNHARLTAAVAARLGMHCELILKNLVAHTDASYARNGNVLLMRNFGARLHILEQNQDIKAYARKRMDDLRAAGRRPYFIPFSGSSVQGALGYVDCVREIKTQLAAQDLQADLVFCATASGSMQAGLVAGFASSRSTTQVRGISVLHPRQKIAPVVSNLANGILMKQGCKPLPHDERAIQIDEGQIGAGYGIPSAAALEAISLLGHMEGMVLDPVYTGKAFAGLMAAAQQERWPEKTVVVFVHSGGVPGLYAHANTLTEHLVRSEQTAPRPRMTPAPTELYAPESDEMDGPNTIIEADDMADEVRSVIGS